MSAKHRLAELPRGKRLSTGISPWAKLRKVYAVAAISAIFAAALAALLVNVIASNRTIDDPVEITQRSPQAAQQVSQEGTVIALSPGSVTARSANGYTQTYLLTPDTTVITQTGSQSLSAASHFTVNDEVAIVGTIQNGRALATAMVHRHMAHGEAPPLESSEGQSSGD